MLSWSFCSLHLLVLTIPCLTYGRTNNYSKSKSKHSSLENKTFPKDGHLLELVMNGRAQLFANADTVHIVSYDFIVYVARNSIRPIQFDLKTLLAKSNTGEGICHLKWTEFTNIYNVWRPTAIYFGIVIYGFMTWLVTVVVIPIRRTHKLFWQVSSIESYFFSEINSWVDRTGPVNESTATRIRVMVGVGIILPTTPWKTLRPN
jgi:hypothetical protein